MGGGRLEKSKKVRPKSLLSEPLLAFLDVLVEEEGHVADDEREDDLCEEF